MFSKPKTEYSLAIEINFQLMEGNKTDIIAVATSITIGENNERRAEND